MHSEIYFLEILIFICANKVVNLSQTMKNKKIKYSCIIYIYEKNEIADRVKSFLGEQL